MNSDKKPFQNVYDVYYPAFIFFARKCWPRGRDAEQVLSEFPLTRKDAVCFLCCWEKNQSEGTGYLLVLSGSTISKYLTQVISPGNEPPSWLKNSAKDCRHPVQLKLSSAFYKEGSNSPCPSVKRQHNLGGNVAGLYDLRSCSHPGYLSLGQIALRDVA